MAAAPAEKVEGESEPRFLEDEGFYVGVKPVVADKNRSRMEDRILKESQAVKEVEFLPFCLVFSLPLGTIFLFILSVWFPFLHPFRPLSFSMALFCFSSISEHWYCIWLLMMSYSQHFSTCFISGSAILNPCLSE